MQSKYSWLAIASALLVAVMVAGCGGNGADTQAERVTIGAAEAGALPASAMAAGVTSAAGEPVTITVYKSPTCGCCTAWEEHLRAHGFAVESRPTADMASVKVARGIPAALSSCHTALVDGYIVEGHVPADVIARMLEERPDILGLTVPGMPMGSPGMEGPYTERYDVLTFDAGGRTTVYASR